MQQRLPPQGGESAWLKRAVTASFALSGGPQLGKTRHLVTFVCIYHYMLHIMQVTPFESSAAFVLPWPERLLSSPAIVFPLASLPKPPPQIAAIARVNDDGLLA